MNIMTANRGLSTAILGFLAVTVLVLFPTSRHTLMGTSDVASLQRQLDMANQRFQGLVDSLWLFTIAQHERKIYSQNGEDGIIEYIFTNLRTTNKYYVEFGTESCQECNTRLLRERYGWTGLLMDNTFEFLHINLHKEEVLPSTVNSLFEKYHVPEEFDLLIAEYNRAYGPNDFTTTPNENRGWDLSCVFGASLAAFDLLMTDRGYKLVYVDKLGINAFFIRRDLLSPIIDQILPFEMVYPYHEQIHRDPSAEKLSMMVDFRNAAGLFSQRIHGSVGDYAGKCSVATKKK